MKSLLLAAAVCSAFFMIASTIDADALVCARGLYRAGCVAGGGVGIYHRHGYGAVAVRGPRGGIAVRGPRGGVAVRRGFRRF